MSEHCPKCASTEELISDVRDAILSQGKVPSHHKEVLARHRAEWPFLWERIDKLISWRSND